MTPTEGSAAGLLRPMYDTLIGVPVREGRLRLKGLSPVVRQVTITGLVTLVALLGSLLFNDLWRRGDLLHLTVSSGRFMFIPVSLFAATIVALFVGWWLVLWGAASATWVVRILAAALFLLVNAPIGRVLLVELSAEASPVIPALVRVGYFAAPSTLLVLSILQIRPAWAGRARPLAQGAILISLAVMFGGLLWSHVLQIRNGISPTLPFALSNAIGNAENVSIPLLIVSGISVIEFSRGVAAAAASPFWAARAQLARIAVTALIVVKLWIQFGRHVGDWASYIASRPGSVVASMFVLAFLVGAVWFARRHRTDPASAEASKERLIYGPAFVLSVPGLLLLLLTTLASFMLTQAGWLDAARIVGELPLARYLSDADAALSAGVLLVGVLVYARRDRAPFFREAGIGLLIVGIWTSTLFFLELLNVAIEWRAPFLDLLLTAGLGLYLVARWRRIDSRVAVGIGAVVLFSWLVMTRGDFVSILGGFVGLPAVTIVVFGTLFALLADSSFASGDSSWFPRRSRPLLWVGYLVVSAAIINWLTASHDTDLTEAVGARGWTYLGIPLAVWLLARVPFHSFTASPHVEDVRGVSGIDIAPS